MSPTGTGCDLRAACWISKQSEIEADFAWRGMGENWLNVGSAWEFFLKQTSGIGGY
jgi:hypothetical protein